VILVDVFGGGNCYVWWLVLNAQSSHLYVIL